MPAAATERIALAAAGGHLSRGALRALSRALAARLAERGVGIESVVAVWASEPAGELAVSVLALLRLGATYLPLDPSWPAARLAQALAVARPRLALGWGPARPTAELSGVPCCEVDLARLARGEAPARRPPSGPIPPEAAAYLLFTSGSTGAPKGVVVPRRALAAHCRGALRAYGPRREDRFAWLAAPGFDPSLEQLLLALASGARCCAVPATERHGAGLLEQIASERLSLVNLTPTQLAGLLAAAEDGATRLGVAGLGAKGLPGCLRQLWVGGEPLSPTLIARLHRLAPAVGVLNLYGPTEAVITATHWQLPPADPSLKTRLLVGRPLPGREALVVDQLGLPVAVGDAGEIVLGGPLARGYAGQPAATALAFRPHPRAAFPGERLYRTGDLGCALPSGELLLRGRRDRQVKWRGVRLELAEIEAALGSHPAVVQAVALLAPTAAGPAELVAVAEPRPGRRPTAAGLRRWLARRLPLPYLPARVRVLPRLPTTAGGKLDLATLAALLGEPVEDGRPQTGAAAAAEPSLAAPIARLSALLHQVRPDLPAPGGDDDLLALGLSSLDWLRWLGRIEDELALRLPLATALAAGSLRRLARRLSRRLPAPRAASLAVTAATAAATASGPWPLSHEQERFYFLASLAPESRAYHCQTLLQITGRLDPAALAASLGATVARHGIYRSRFTSGADGPRQWVEPAYRPSLPMVDLSGLGTAAGNELAARLAAALARPFGLDRLPLARWTLFRLAGGAHRLLHEEHHLVHDGWSVNRFWSETLAVYRQLAAGEPPAHAPPPPQFIDHALAQRARVAAGEARHRRFFRRLLAGQPATLTLPLDRPRPAAASYRGGSVRRWLPAATQAAVEAAGQRWRVTPFAIFLGAFFALLREQGGESDLVLGTTTANRTLPASEGVLGPLVGTLPVRVRGPRDPSFLAVVRRTARSLAAVLSHQDLPLDRLLTGSSPDLAANPGFQVLFSQHDAPPPLLGGAASNPQEATFDLLEALPNGFAKLDLDVLLLPRPRGPWSSHEPPQPLSLQIFWDYASDLFDATSIERLARRYEGLLAAGLAEPETALAALPRWLAHERQQLLFEWGSGGRLGRGPLLPEAIAAWAAAAADRIALVEGEDRLSFGALQGRATDLARKLLAAGCGPEEPVGVEAARTAELVVSILGVLQAGAAFVPLPTDLPSRRQAILADAGIAQVVELADLAAITGAPAGPALPRLAPEQLAYVLFTSGSTGRPKGVMISHGSLAALLAAWRERYLEAGGAEAYLATASPLFDVFVADLAFSLASGARLVLAGTRTAAEPKALVALARRERAAIADLVPGQVRPWLKGGLDAEGLAGVPWLLVGAESWAGAELAGVRRLAGPGVRVWSGYGVTEATVDAASFAETGLARLPGQPVPIGRPLAGVRLAVVDRDLEPVGLGVAGELVIAGAGLARGYVGRPGLTADRFRPLALPGAGAGERLYRSGDRARTLADGQLELLGRLDRQLKVHGLRVEPAEIEAALVAAPTVTAAAVVPGEGGLTAFITPATELAEGWQDGLRRHLADRLPAAMVPASYIALPALPSTASGKLDRSRLAALAAGSDRPQLDVHEPPRPGLEKALAELWEGVLAGGAVSRRASFFTLGGDSFATLRLAARAQAAGLPLTPRDLFRAPVLADLAALLAGRPAVDEPPAPSAAEELPLWPAQPGIVFEALLAPEAATHALLWAWELTGPLRRAALAAAQAELGNRHAALRSRFERDRDGELRWRVTAASASGARPRLPVIDLTGLTTGDQPSAIARLEAALRHRLRPLGGPLHTACLLALTPVRHRLSWALHHAIVDGWSVAVLGEELLALYAASVLGRPAALSPAPSLARRAPQPTAADRAAWRQALADQTVSTPLAEPARPAADRRLRWRSLPPGLGAELAAVAQRLGIPPSCLLDAAWALALGRETGAERVAFGIVVAGRDDDGTGRQRAVGPLAHVLPLSLDAPRRGPVAAWLAACFGERRRLLAQPALPLAELRQLSGVPPRLPWFGSLLAFQAQPAAGLDGAAATGLRVTVAPSQGSGSAVLDLAVLPGEPWQLRAEHDAGRLPGSRVERLLRRFAAVLAAFADGVADLAAVPAWLPAERQALLTELQGGQTAARPTEIDVFAVGDPATAPDAVALVVPGDGGELLSRGELARRVRHFAAGLSPAQPEAPVALLLPRAAELVVAVLGCLAAGTPYAPLDPALPPARRQRLLARLAPSLVVASAAEVRAVEAAGHVAAHRAVPPEGLANVLFTSGSTGEPKAIGISRQALASFLAAFAQRLPPSLGERWLAITPLSFDIAALELLRPWTTGGRLVLAPEGIGGDATCLAHLLAEQGASHLQATPATWRLLAESSWEGDRGLTALAGGEALSGALATALRPRVGKLWNLYGPTEATLWATAWPVPRPAAGEATPVAIGLPLTNSEAHVLGRHGELLPAGAGGEIWLGGDGLARGYLGSPAATAEHFRPHPFSRLPGARLYASGDLGRRRTDGSLETGGRRDGQVKVRGQRVELGEIEHALASRQDVAEAAVALWRRAPEDAVLVAYVVPRAAPDSTGLLGALRAELARQLPAAWVPERWELLPALPRTGHGKVDRRALPAPEAPPTSLEAAGPGRHGIGRSPLEELVLATWREILGEPTLGLHAHLFEHGAHSLSVTRAALRLGRLLDRELAVRLFFEAPTVATQAAALAEVLRGVQRQPVRGFPGHPDRRPLPRYPLSSGQQRLWFLAQLAPLSPAYNLALGFDLRGPLAAGSLARAGDQLGARHPVLAAHLETSGPAPQQAPGQRLPPPAVIDLGGLRPADAATLATALAQREAALPFDLERGPWLRCRLLRLAPAHHRLSLTVHHIAADGWSLGVIARDLAALYAAACRGGGGAALPAAVPFGEYALWQQEQLVRGELDAALAYWRQALAGASPAPPPSDRPAPPLPPPTWAAGRSGETWQEAEIWQGAAMWQGAELEVQLPPSLATAVERAALEAAVTPFTLLLAAYGALLARCTPAPGVGPVELVLGVPVANRQGEGLEDAVGLFANNLALRFSVAGDDSLARLLGRVREVVLGAYAHQELPFERLVAELNPERIAGQNPLFQLTFALQSAPGAELALSGLETRRLDPPLAAARFDLELYLWPAAGTLRSRWVYRTALFDATTVRRLAAAFERLLAAAVARPSAALSDLPLLSPAERHQLLAEASDRERELALPPSLEAGLVPLLARQPATVALVDGDEHLSFAALDRAAWHLAERLAADSVGLDAVVALDLDRSAALVVSQLAVLRAGGAYLAVDPGWPAARKHQLLRRAGARLRLLTAPTATGTGDVPCRVLGPLASLLAARPPAALAGDLGSRDDLGERAAYVLFTSGTSGGPKPVVVTQAAIVHHMRWMAAEVPLAATDRLLFKTAASFDASVWEVWAPLLAGARLEVAPAGLERDPAALLALATARRVSVLQAVPTYWQELAAEGAFAELGDLRLLASGGEALPRELAARLLAALPGATLVNLYGPTEATIHAATAVVGQGELAHSPLPLGRPIANTALRVLSTRGELQPLGVVGELAVSGPGLARGYLGAPALTAARFRPDPWATAPGGRRYLTGDLARWACDLTLGYHGRRDRQGKLRGVRYEPGEIEGLLADHPEVAAAAVELVAAAAGPPRLVAFVASRPEARAATGDAATAEHLAGWQALYDQLYGDGAPATEGYLGWVSSLTGAAIPRAEMDEWLGGTLARLRALAPRRLLEIGCGEGLLALPLLDELERFCGLDLAAPALERLRARVPAGAAAKVELHRAAAHELAARLLGGSGADRFDLVVLNSVVQYFPSLEYFLRVLAGAVEVTAPQGRIFVGDLRSLPLLPLQALAVEAAAGPSRSAELLAAAAERCRREEELVLDPALFAALPGRLARVAAVEVLPKLGSSPNELQMFRFDVVLHLDVARRARAAPCLDLAALPAAAATAELRRLLAAGPDEISFRGVPNALLGPLLDLAAAARAAPSATTAAWAPALPPAGDLRLAELSELAAAAGYRLRFDLAAASPGERATGRLAARLTRAASPPPASRRPAAPGPVTGEVDALAAGLAHFANQPLAKRRRARLASELAARARARLPEVLRPAEIVVLDALPRLASGKLDRRSLVALLPPRARWLAAPAPTNASERPGVELLAPVTRAFGELLGLAGVDPETSFFTLGGHSLLAAQLARRLRSELGRELPLAAVFEHPTAAGLAAFLAGGAPPAGPASPAAGAGARDEAPLSFAQEQLWLLAQLDDTSPAYNAGLGWEIQGGLEVERLARALRRLGERHTVLRATVHQHDGVPFQRLAPTAPARLPLVDLAALRPADRATTSRALAGREQARRFDLERGPLLRACLLRSGTTHHDLLLTFHHLVFDGSSLAPLCRELAAGYRGEGLAPLATTVLAQARRERQAVRQDEHRTALAFWRGELANLARLRLPQDRPTPPRLAAAGAEEVWEWPRPMAERLARLGRELGATPFMASLACFHALLGRWSGSPRVATAVPFAGREPAATEELVGFFVNTLVFAADLAGRPSLRGLISASRGRVERCLAQGRLPFELLVAELGPERQLSGNPWLSTSFAFQSVPPGELALAGLAVRPRERPWVPARFDLEVQVPAASTTIPGRWRVLYRPQLFDRATIAALGRRLFAWLEAALATPEAPLFDLPWLTAAERQQLLVEWTAGPAPGRPPRSIGARFQARARAVPEAIALTAPATGETWSYAALARWAAGLATHLAELGTAAEERVAVLAPLSSELVAGFLAALGAGVAYLPIPPATPLSRCQDLLSRFRPALCWLGSGVRPPAGTATPCRSLLAPAGTSLAPRRPRPPLPAQAAYVLPTSGSTGEPRGVVVSHAALEAYLEHCRRAYAPAAGPSLLHTDPAFDLTVTSYLPPLLAGQRVVIADGDDPRATAATLADAGPWGLVKLTPSHLRLLAGPATVDCLVVGGEPLVREQLAGWQARRVCNEYGPTEATVGCAVAELGPAAGWFGADWFEADWAEAGDGRAVPIGRPIAGASVWVFAAGPAGAPCQPAPAGVAGELWVGGGGLARGYLGAPAATAARFRPHPCAEQPGERLFATGDRARFRHDGQLEILGRLDEQVKVLGHRIEPAEVAAALARHPAVAEAAVVARELAGMPALVAFWVARPGSALPAPSLHAFLAGLLPRAWLPARWVELDSLPRTARGKLDRRALGERPLPEATAAAPAPSSPREEIVAGVFAEVLGRAAVDHEASFFVLGGHSLLAMRALSRLEAALGTRVPLRALFEHPSAAALAVHLTALQREATGLTPAPASPAAPGPAADLSDGDAPLSPGQQRLWLLAELAPESSAYHMPTAHGLDGPLDAGALSRAFAAVARRHEVLRSVVDVAAGTPRQRFLPRGPGPAVVDLSALARTDTAAAAGRLGERSAARPFRLSSEPPWRWLLVRLDGEHHRLHTVFHHIAADGGSEAIFWREVSQLYAITRRDPAVTGARLAAALPATAQYARHAREQRALAVAATREVDRRHWREALAGAPYLELPLDRPAAAGPTAATAPAGSCDLTLDAATTTALEELSRREAASLFLTSLTAWLATLATITGSRDLVIGTILSQRPRRELEDALGFFVNTLPVRLRITGSPAFGPLLAAVRANVLAAYDHQDLPFDQLVAELAPERGGGPPLFATCFSFHQGPARRLELGGLTVRELEVPAQAPRFLLDVHLGPHAGTLSGRLLFDRARLDASTVARWAAAFGRALAQATVPNEAPLTAWPWLSASERHQLLVETATQAAEGPADNTVDLIFAELARRPQSVALEAAGEHLSAAALRRAALGVAAALRARGVGAGQRVVVCLDRGPEWVIAWLGALAAGAALVPLDPELPAARRAELARRGAGSAHFDDLPAVHRAAATPPLAGPVAVPAEAPFHRLFTSGSTGEPKAVEVPRLAVARLLAAVAQQVGCGPADRFLALTSAGFDIAALEVWLPLTHGARLVVAPSAAGRDGFALAAALAAHRTTLAQATPSRWWLLAAAGWQGEPQLGVLCGGEAMPADLGGFLQARCRAVWNLYGPTETTIWSSAEKLTGHGELLPGSAAVSLGRPLAGERWYLLDSTLRPVLWSSPGRLFLAGAGLAIGYAGAPGATAASFLPDPWGLQPGARMYASGDLARRGPDGRLWFLGRADRQLKVRGWRLEPGEVEACLRELPEVAEVTVRPWKAATARELTVVAYVVPAPRRRGELAADELAQVAGWAAAYDEVYASAPPAGDPALDSAGWVTSTTAAPIPAAEMAEWAEALASRVLALAPRRVLEIGCGTGMVLLRVAPACATYVGTDIAAGALARLRPTLAARGLTQVELRQQAAHDLTGLPAGSFDLVVLSSVVQYFPSLAYLRRVLHGALTLLAPGGALFVGDVRDLDRADDEYRHRLATSGEPTAAVALLAAQEEELLVARAFFRGLAAELPALGAVAIADKASRFDNEMARYRYDVTLRLAPSAVVLAAGQAPATSPTAGLANDPLGARRARRLRRRLERQARERLPAAARPQHYLLLPALPRTLSGKLDDRALPDPEALAPTFASPGPPPASPLELAVAAAWEEALGVAPPALDSHFFALGGHSLAATEVVARLRSRLRAAIPMRWLFDYPRLGDFAARLEALGSEPEPAEAAASVAATSASRGLLPVTAAQQRMWMLQGLAPTSPAYTLSLGFELAGPLCVARLWRAWEQLLRRHEALRTRFVATEAGLRQRVAGPPGRPHLPVVDLGDLAPTAQAAERRRLAAGGSQLTGDLQRGPVAGLYLVRQGPARHDLGLLVHHAVADGQSLAILSRELGALYAGEPLSPSSGGPRPSELGQREAAWLASPAAREHRSFWAAALAGVEPWELPRDRPRAASALRRSGWRRCALTAPIANPLSELARRAGASSFHLLLALFATLLRRQSGRRRGWLVSPVSLRDELPLQELVACQINSLPLVLAVDDEAPFTAQLAAVRRHVLAALEHKALPLEAILAPAGDHDGPHGPQPQFALSFALHEQAPATLALSGLAVRPLELTNPAPRLDLEVYLEPTADGWSGCFVYDAAVLDATTIERWARAFTTLAATVVERPDAALAELCRPTASERQQLLEWGGAARQATAPDVMLEIAGRGRSAAERIAVVVMSQDGDATGDEQWSYGALLVAAAQRAASLVETAAAGPVLPLVDERGAAALVEMLACLAAGLAFLPLDPAWPVERQRAIHDATARAAGSAAAPALGSPPASDASLAAVLHTSGSSGEPNPVALSRGNLAAYSAAAIAAYGLTAEDRVLHAATLAFDLALEEVLPTLAAGARLVVDRAGLGGSPLAWLGRLAERRVTVMSLPTAFWHLLANEVEAPAGLDALRLLVIGGEAARGEPLARWQARWPAVPVLNTYGPTEATVVATVSRLAPGSPATSQRPPVGRPFGASRLLVVDATGTAAAPGVPGELWLGGPGLAWGYLGRPRLTASRFVPDPTATQPGSRLYRSGDRARFRADGELELLGRLDRQLKVRGQRLEPAEVEACLERLPTVAAAAVDGRPGPGGEPALVAWVVPTPGEELDPAALRRELARHLSAAQLPWRIVPLAALPLNARGKVDRAGLRLPAAAPAIARTRADDSAVERLVRETFAQVLGVDAGTGADFFLLGGHSLAAVRLLAAIERRLGLRLPLAALLEHPTVEGLARHLVARDPQPPRSALVPLRPGHGTPLFLLHPAGGHVLCYQRLCAHLSAGPPIFGLEARPRRAGAAAPSLGELALAYLAAVRTVQPQGPYRLGGWSLGGMLAYEMARQLLSAGEQVSLLALIDSGPALAAATARERERALEPAAFLRHLGRPPAGERAHTTPSTVAAEGLDELYALYRDNVSALADYRAGRFAGRVTLFRPRFPLLAEDHDLGWADYAAGGVDILPTPGDHYSVLEEPHVRRLARLLDRSLGAAPES